MRKVSGFTIIELVVVITILGILAAIALPKFFDVQNDARQAAAAGVAGAISSASAINYGGRIAKGSLIAASNVTVVACSSTAGALGKLLSGGFPTNVSVIASSGNVSLDTVGTTASGTTGFCVFFDPAGGGSTTAAVIVTNNT